MVGGRFRPTLATFTCWLTGALQWIDFLWAIIGCLSIRTHLRISADFNHVIEGVATDPDQPVLRRLAEGLHRHHLGAVSFSRGVRADEVGQALRALAGDVERNGPLGLLPDGQRLEWPHLRLHPLTFDRLELVSLAPEKEGATAPSDGRAAELWVGLARAAMAADQSGEPGACEKFTGPPSAPIESV